MMSRLLKLLEGNSALLSSIAACEKQVTPILQGFITNFPDYTDHSINHSKTVLVYADYLVESQIEKLNQDEIYILIMAAYLHDIGMCPTREVTEDLKRRTEFLSSGKSFEDYLRDVHHEISYDFIVTNWKTLGIVSEPYAEAIGLVGKGHRVVNLMDFSIYNPEYPVKSGKEFVCLPFLAAILRMADELDITNDRTPELLYNQYLPTNKVSKSEWEKHKANYFVNFHQPSIKITSNCHSKDLYYALIKQYGKLDSVLKYVHRVITSMPHNDRSLNLEYYRIEKDIKPIGFIPKEIGFSFDLQNTINTFIGDNIYKEKLVAIRECLQNAIDTCRFKKSLSEDSYKPVIHICHSNGILTIDDNGFGMDEFIVEHYFARLAKSYYTETKISKEFEAISQFGIGVFSYFLICDYFEVETKQEAKNPIKFRATKLADNFFHFYDNPAKKESGTKITFFLKEPIEYNELIEKVKHYIRFVEFDIIIQTFDGISQIKAEEFILDKVALLGNRISREYSSNLNELVVVEKYISNNSFDGKVGILFSMDETNTYIPIYNYQLLQTYSTTNVELSQKGIFVGNLGNTVINNVIGKINFKRKNDIDLGRYKIKDNQAVNSALFEFYIDVFKQVFRSWNVKSPRERTKLTSDLLSFYIDSYSFDDAAVFNPFFDDLYFAIFNDKGFGYLPLSEIFKFENLVLVHEDDPFAQRRYEYETVDKIYDKFKMTLVLQHRYSPAKLLFKWLKEHKKHPSIRTTEKHWFLLFKDTPDSTAEENLIYTNEVYEFDSEHLAAYTGIDLSAIFNKSHSILRYYKVNKVNILRDPALSRDFNKFWKEASEFMWKIHSSTSRPQQPIKEISYLQSILSSINSKIGSNFILSSQDFPEWINRLIKW